MAKSQEYMTTLLILTGTLRDKYTRCIEVFYLYVSRGCEYDACFLLTLGTSPSTEFAQISLIFMIEDWCGNF